MKILPAQENDNIRVNEDFVTVDVRQLDSKHRITLSGKLMKAVAQKVKKIDFYQVLVGKNGDILLKPTVSIPASEAWIYENPKIIASIRKGVEDIKKGKTIRVADVDAYLDKL